MGGISMQRHQKMKRIKIVVLVVGFLVAFTSCTATIADNERGVYFDRNGDAHLLEPGQHFLGWMPVDVHIVSTEVQTYTMAAVSGGSSAVADNNSIEARSADGLQLYIDAEVVFQVIPDRAIDLVTTFGSDQSRYIWTLVRPTARSIIYNTAAKFNSADIVGAKRGEAEAAMSEQLAEQLQRFGIKLLQLTLLKVANE
jgi:regulator of protease activity HflC (stomatin/prohibitin superfamily)